MKSSRFSYAVFVLLVIADQYAKYLAYSGSFWDFLNALRPTFGFQIFPNANFAFSLPVPIVLMYAIYAVVLIGLVAWYVSRPVHTWKTALAMELILAGALSNIVDRILLGYVRDFIFVFWGNVFNLADVFIVAGVLLLLFSS